MTGPEEPEIAPAPEADVVEATPEELAAEVTGLRAKVAELEGKLADTTARLRAVSKAFTDQQADGEAFRQRTSALMDERMGSEWKPVLSSPISWTHVSFFFADHLGLTQDAAFTDNVLYLLLEDPR